MEDGRGRHPSSWSLWFGVKAFTAHGSLWPWWWEGVRASDGVAVALSHGAALPCIHLRLVIVLVSLCQHRRRDAWLTLAPLCLLQGFTVYEFSSLLTYNIGDGPAGLQRPLSSLELCYFLDLRCLPPTQHIHSTLNVTSPFNTHNTWDNDKDNEPFPLTSDMNLESLPTESPKAMASNDLALAHMEEKWTTGQPWPR